jgi:YggT family protein
VNIFHLLGLLLEAYIWLIMFPYAILSWFRIQPGTTLAKVQYFLYQVNEPVLRPVRRVIKPMGQFDFSFLVVFVVLQFVAIPVLLSR